MPPTTGTPHPECVQAVREHLLAKAAEHYALAEKQWANRRTRACSNVARRMAVAFGWSAGQLRDLVGR